MADTWKTPHLPQYILTILGEKHVENTWKYPRGKKHVTDTWKTLHLPQYILTISGEKHVENVWQNLCEKNMLHTHGKLLACPNLY